MVSKIFVEWTEIYILGYQITFGLSLKNITLKGKFLVVTKKYAVFTGSNIIFRISCKLWIHFCSHNCHFTGSFTKKLQIVWSLLSICQFNMSFQVLFCLSTDATWRALIILWIEVPPIVKTVRKKWLCICYYSLMMNLHLHLIFKICF